MSDLSRAIDTAKVFVGSVFDPTAQSSCRFEAFSRGEEGSWEIALSFLSPDAADPTPVQRAIGNSPFAGRRRVHKVFRVSRDGMAVQGMDDRAA